LQIIFNIKFSELEIKDYPETDHPSIEDIVDDSVNVKMENFVYPEEVHPDLEDIIEI
jgi:hypothetical protein